MDDRQVLSDALARAIRRLADVRNDPKKIAAHLAKEIAPLTAGQTLPLDLGEAVQALAVRADDTDEQADQAVKMVFEYWKRKMKHPNAKLGNDREQKIRARLRSFTVEQIVQAIDGCANTPHNMGANEHGQRFDDLELICRSDAKLEYFIARAPKTTLRRPLAMGSTIVTTTPEERIEALRVEATKALDDGRTEEYERLNAEIREELRRANA